MKNFNFKTAIQIILICLFSSIRAGANAQETTPETKEVEKIDIYKLPTLDDQPKLRYPISKARNSQEGWVDINFMVDTAGQTFEPTVLDTSHGGEAFVDSVLKHVSGSKYIPATNDGEPVEASVMKRYLFQMESGYDGTTTRAFYRGYKSFNDALEKEDQAEARKYLDELLAGKAKNLYDDSYLNLALYFYEEKYGSKEKSMHYLNRALSDERQSEYLEKDFYKQALTLLFQIQANQKHYREALHTYSVLTKSKDNFELLTKLEPFVDQIEALRTNDTAYAIPTELDDDGDWNIKLFKSGFSLSDVNGNINEIQLRCSKKYIFFAYLEDKEYHIPKSYGNCSTRVIGDPETSFNFVQFQGITDIQ